MQVLSNILLLIHSYWRWVVLLLLIVTFIKMLIGWLSKGGYWREIDTNLNKWLGMALGIQFLLGLILLAFSVLTNGSGFFEKQGLVEHIASNFIAVILGSLSFKKAADNTRFRNRAIAILVASLLIVRAIMAIQNGSLL